MSLDLARNQENIKQIQYHARKNGDDVILNFDGSKEKLSVKDHGDGRLELSAPKSPIHFKSVLSAFEALTNHNAEEVLIILNKNDWGAYAQELLHRGAAVDVGDQWLGVFPELLWQLPDLWLAQSQTVFPQTVRQGPNGPHPLRPPKPSGEMYHRYIPWLDQVFSLRALDTVHDLDLFHKWMNDERVAAFFDEAGTLKQHQDYLAKMNADPHMLPVLGSLDGKPFCYFELYWAKENRIGAHYDAQAWDRGWHVLVGDENARGVDYITTWLPSLMHYMFLVEPRTQALVGEPATSHTQQLRNLTRSGFARIKDFDFPHKRATLVQLERDYFFKARLWARPNPTDPGQPFRWSLSKQLNAGASI